MLKTYVSPNQATQILGLIFTWSVFWSGWQCRQKIQLPPNLYLRSCNLQLLLLASLMPILDHCWLENLSQLKKQDCDNRHRSPDLLWNCSRQFCHVPDPLLCCNGCFTLGFSRKRLIQAELKILTPQLFQWLSKSRVLILDGWFFLHLGGYRWRGILYLG